MMDYIAALDKAFVKVQKMSAQLTQFPHITKDGAWLTHEYGHWTGGFWTGLIWLMSYYRPEAESKAIREQANGWAKRLQKRMTDNKTHDMGFIFGPSCVLGDRIAGDSELREMARSGAHNMKDLYEPRVGLVLAWDEPGYEGKAIVDTIMNVPLMIWAAEEFQEPELKTIGLRVADQIMKYHVREDDSIYHMVRWDTNTFEIVERTTHQGFAPETCWSRGHSWALYGFANMYRYTGEQRYLDTSIRLAHYFWQHCDDDTRLPRWDFVFKNNQAEPIDAAAASIASSGMLLLASLLSRGGGQEEAKIWNARGEAMVASMIEHCLYTSLDKYGIIEKATVDKPRNSGIQESTMYGDYYFVEALYRIVNRGNRDMIDILY